MRKILSLFIGAALLSCMSSASSKSIVIQDGNVYVSSKLFPFGEHADSVYSELFGAYSHVGDDRSLYWLDEGIMLQRRSAAATCTVIFRAYLMEDGLRYIGQGKDFIQLKAQDGAIVVEGVEIKPDTNLSMLMLKTKASAVVSPFGYAFVSSGNPTVEILIYQKFEQDKNMNFFVEVMVKEFDSVCKVN